VSVSRENEKLVNESVRGESITLGIRPEHLKIGSPKDAGATGLKAKVVSFEPLGSKTIVYMHPDNNPRAILKSSMDSDFKPKLGEVKHLIINEKDLYLFDRKSTDLVMRFGS
jgi:ABC-type sugar transport system ATPase subunit